MQRSTLFITGVLLLFSCSSKHGNDDEEPTGRKTRVDFSIAESISRTTMDGSYNTSFSLKDQIGIFATGGASASNVKYTVAEDNKLTSTAPISTDGSGNPCNFYAYYPYSADNGNSDAITLSVNADQSTSEAFLASDFLTASAQNVTVVKDERVRLAFKHRMAMIDLTVVMPEGQDSPISVTLTNVLTQVQWNQTDDQLTTTGDKASIIMLGTGSNSCVYRAIVPMQTVAQGTPIFSIETIMGKYTVTASQDIGLKSNMVKQFKVGVETLLEDVEQISAEVSISSWTVDEEVITGQGVENVASYIFRQNWEEPVTFGKSYFSKLSELPTDDGWYSRTSLESESMPVEIIDDPTGTTGGKVATLHVLKPISRSCLTYMIGYFATGIEPGVYRMRAKVTSNSDANPDYKKNAYRFVMSAVLFNNVEIKGLDPQFRSYFANGSSPDGSMEITTYPRIPSVDTYDFRNEYKVITADVDLTECYYSAEIDLETKTDPTTTTQEMYNNGVLFYIGADYNTRDILYVDSFSVELIEEK